MKLNFSKRVKMVSGQRSDSNNGRWILSGLREHEMSHRRSLKVRYFPGARIADIKHYSVPFLMKQLEHIILPVGTNDALSLTPEIMFKELKELHDFILKFLPDVKINFLTTSNKNRQIKRNKKQQLSQKGKVWLHTSCEHYRRSFKCLRCPYKWVRHKSLS